MLATPITQCPLPVVVVRSMRVPSRSSSRSRSRSIRIGASAGIASSTSSVASDVFAINISLASCCVMLCCSASSQVWLSCIKCLGGRFNERNGEKSRRSSSILPCVVKSILLHSYPALSSQQCSCVLITNILRRPCSSVRPSVRPCL